ncbi:MAG: phage major capsid protein [Atribacterota bacterium]|nr:phage major capsid protein [Atribacterota bacterium]
MDKIRELKQKRAKIIKEMRTILSKAEEEKRDLTEDEQKKYNEFDAEVNSLKETIEREERQLELESNMDEPVNEPIRNEPQRPEEKRFKSLGEQLAAVINASTPGVRNIDDRLIESRAASGMGESVPADGGFLVQTDFSTELIKHVHDASTLYSRVRKIPVSSNADSLKINAVNESSRVTGSRWGGIQIYWASEAELITAKKPAFRQMELKLNKLMGLCYATDELIKDTSALESVITQAFTEEFSFIIDDSIFNGNGVGQPLGIMNSGALISVTRDTANDIKFADIMGMWKQFHAPSRKNAVWLINQVAEVELFGMTLTDYVPVYMPPGGISGGQYGTLLGRPVVAIEQTSDDVGTTGDIMLADLSQYLMIEKGGLESASSLHVRFLYDEQVFRFVYRCDGQPIWNTTLTTYGGNNTVSPFVVLSTKNS